MSSQSPPPSDALVYFGATGDLGLKKTWPALQLMCRQGDLDVPVVCVAKAGWTLDDLRRRVRESLTAYGGGLDESAYDRLMERVSYVDGDYGDPATFERIRAALGAARRPTHYLAIPPGLFGPVVQALGRAGLAPAALPGARVMIEKPFGQDVTSAGALNAAVREVFPEDAIFRVDHYL